MTEHEFPVATEGVVRIAEDGTWKLPEGYRTNVTVHTVSRTIVRHSASATIYDTAHPELARDGDGVFLAISRFGDDDWTYFEFVPWEAEPKTYPQGAVS